MSTDLRTEKRIMSVDEFLDSMEFWRIRKQLFLSEKHGKGFREDKPERQGVTATSNFNRHKLGDFKQGYE